MKRIARKVGADIFVTGEAFTQLVSSRTEDTELGQVRIIRCRGRGEVRAMRTATAEIIFSDSEQGTGPAEPTEELSSKAALEDLGVRLVPRLVKKLEGMRNFSTVLIEVRGIERAKDANAIARFIKSIPGVLTISEPELEGRNMTVEVSLGSITSSELAEKLESSATLKAYKLQAQSTNKSKIVLNARNRPGVP